MGKRKDTINCGICAREIDGDKPHVVETYWACSEEAARNLGIPTSGQGGMAVCLECREKEQGSRLQ